MKPPSVPSVKSALKYHLQTPLNQRCTDYTNRAAALSSLVPQPPPTDFERQCFNREYEQHHADGRGLHDWRLASVASILLVSVLFVFSAVNAQDLPPIPKSIPATPRLYYFSLLTCSKIGTNVYADWSNEVIVTNAQLHSWTGTWNPDPAALFYTLFQGRKSRQYTNGVDTTGTTATIVVAPFPPTNRIITITSSGATNLQYRPWGGTWMFTGWTNRTITNPPYGNQYRAVGRKSSPPQISITITNQ